MEIGGFQVQPTLRPEDVVVDMDHAPGANRWTRTNSESCLPRPESKTVRFNAEVKPFQRRAQRRRQLLRTFLRKHGFDEVDRARTSSYSVNGVPYGDEVFPIHVAALLGDLAMLRYLVAAGADPQQRTGRGFSAMYLAMQHLSGPKQQLVVDYLQSPTKTSSMRDFVRSTRTMDL